MLIKKNMATIKKKDFPSFTSVINEYSNKTKFKPDRFFDLGDAFLDATGLPGPSMGHINMFLGHSDTGKAQPLTSNILTPNGWKQMGEVKIGDVIIGSDGKEQHIIGVYPQGIRPVYKVETTDGGIVFCDEDHLWSVSDYKTRRKKTKNDEFKTLKTIDMVDNVKYKIGNTLRNNYRLPKLDVVEFNEKPLTIDPYILGRFLANDSLSNTNDNEIKKTTYYQKHINGKRQFNSEYIEEDIATIELNEQNVIDLKSLELYDKKQNEKFIPIVYLFNSTPYQRINLLQGLIDSNGYIDKRINTSYFTTPSEKLCNDTTTLVRSLGGLVNVNVKYENEIASYVLTIKLNNNNVNRYIKNIEFSHNEECQCIKVSNADCLYVTDDFVLTHNTTALLGSASDAIKKGILPVFIITEQKFDFNHANIMGIPVTTEVDEETGEITYNGQYIFRNDFDYIEQITDFINLLLDEQEKGKIPFDLLFLWDSVGSVPCKMTFEGKGGKQHNASVLSDKIGMGINQRISGSRRSEKPFTNTLIIVNQPWVELPDNPFGQPKIKAKGGESIWLNSTLVFLFGNQKNAGTTKISITKNKRTINMAIRSKITVMKNHVNGITFADGKIMVTPHGFLKAKEPIEEKKSREDYVKNNLTYISKLFGEKISTSEISQIEFVETSDEDEV